MVLFLPTIALQVAEEAWHGNTICQQRVSRDFCAENRFTTTTSGGDGARTCARQTGESRFGYRSLMGNQQRVGALGAGELGWQR